jgi:SAM-dependent methyltransferase
MADEHPAFSPDPLAADTAAGFQSEFDAFAASWDAEHGPRSVRAAEFAARANLLRAICREIGLPRVLDIGCATGRLLLHLEDAIVAGLGIDSSPAMIARAQPCARSGCVTFRLADAVGHCRTCGETFDLVVLSGVLAHLPDPSATLSAIRDVLSPRGQLVVISPHPWNPLFRLKLILDGGWDAPQACHLAPSALVRLARQHGLVLVHAHSLPYAPWGWMSALRGRLGAAKRRRAHPARAGLASGAFALRFRLHHE